MPGGGVDDLITTFLTWGVMIRDNLGVLGWVDTPLPLIAVLGYAGIIAILIYASWRSEPHDTRGSLIGVGYFLALLLGVSVMMIYMQSVWQGRYILPAIAAGVLYFGLVLRYDDEPSRYRHLFGLSALAWVISVGGALWLLARFSYGMLTGPRLLFPNITGGAFWLPPIGGWWVIVLALVAAMAVPLYLLGMAPKANGSGRDGQLPEGAETVH
jgi:hypothetical protein